jgi:signal transduction histidine kinase
MKEVLCTDLIEHTNTMAKNLAMNSRYGILTLDKNELDMMAENTMKQKDVVYVRIENKDNNVFSQVGKAVREKEEKEFSEPIIGGLSNTGFMDTMLFGVGEPLNNEQIGKVTIVVSLSSLNAKIRYLTKIITGFSIIIAFLLILCIIFIMNAYVDKPIKKIINATRNIAQGDLTHRIDITSRDEFGKLSEFFNKMTEDLQISLENSKQLAVTAARAEIEIKRSKELQRANKEIKIKTVELIRSNQELQEYAHVISHDLREPLCVVTRFLELLKLQCSEKLDADENKYINYAIEGADNMKLLIQNLLAYARVDSNKQTHELNDLETIIKQACDNLSILIHNNKAVVTHDPLPSFMVDKLQIIQLFQNLIANAIKYRTDSPPVVHIGVVRERDKYVFSVRDNGIGIDPQYFEQIFKIFHRIKTVKEYQGTGIGLAICKKIVERHGGDIWLDSTPGAGTTFFFSLPIGLSPLVKF